MPRQILVVDDEPFMHVFMSHHLKRAGYGVIAARNGREALERALTDQPDLVVMDVMMSELDGLSALRELKHNDATRHLPVISDHHRAPESRPARNPRRQGRLYF